MLSVIEIILIATIGTVFLTMPQLIIDLFAKLEWLQWKILLKDKSTDFKSYFKNRNPTFIRILGVVLFFAIFADLILRTID